MNKILNGRELAEYIKQRQSRDVRSLVQARGIRPKLAIIQLKDDPTINVYVSLLHQVYFLKKDLTRSYEVVRELGL